MYQEWAAGAINQAWLTFGFFVILKSVTQEEEEGEPGMKDGGQFYLGK